MKVKNGKKKAVPGLSSKDRTQIEPEAGEPLQFVVVQDPDNSHFFQSGKQFLLDQSNLEEFFKWAVKSVKNRANIELSLRCKEFQVGLRQWEEVSGGFFSRSIEVKKGLFMSVPNTEARKSRLIQTVTEQNWIKVRGSTDFAPEYVVEYQRSWPKSASGKLLDAINAQVEAFRIKGPIALNLRLFDLE